MNCITPLVVIYYLPFKYLKRLRKQIYSIFSRPYLEEENAEIESRVEITNHLRRNVKKTIVSFDSIISA